MRIWIDRYLFYGETLFRVMSDKRIITNQFSSYQEAKQYVMALLKGYRNKWGIKYKGVLNK
jgi:hypothetical protein